MWDKSPIEQIKTGVDIVEIESINLHLTRLRGDPFGLGPRRRGPLLALRARRGGRAGEPDQRPAIVRAHRQPCRSFRNESHLLWDTSDENVCRMRRGRFFLLPKKIRLRSIPRPAPSHHRVG